MSPDFLAITPAVTAAVDRLGWVLLHSLWQFAAVAAAAALVLAVLGRSTAAARHACSPPASCRWPCCRS